VRVEGFEDPLEEGQKNSIASSSRHLRSPASVVPAVPGHAAGKSDRAWGGSSQLCLGLCLPLCRRRRRGKIASGINCKTKPSWKWKVYEQVEGYVSSRASQRAVQYALVGELQRRSSSLRGVRPRKRARLQAQSLEGVRCHTVLQEIAVGCSRTGIALSHWKPSTR